MNLEEAYANGARSFNKPRGDELDAHLSDLGKCKFDVHSRRSGKPRVFRSVATALRLQKGLHDEKFIVDRIFEGLDPAEGWQLMIDEVVTGEITGHIDMIIARAKCQLHCGSWMVRDDAGSPVTWYCECAPQHNYKELMCGIERRLIEIKTTEFKKSGGEFVPKNGSAKETHILQAGGYALELPKNPDGKHMPFAIVEYCRRSNTVCQWPAAGEWFYPDEPHIANWVAQERAEVIDLTAPGVDPVAAGIAFMDSNGLMYGSPPEKFWCRYCDNALCAMNENPDNADIPA